MDDVHILNKVFFINSVCGTGSVGRIVAGLMKELKSRGVDSFAAYGRKRAPEELPSRRIGSELDVLCHGALSRITDRHGLYSVRATKRLVEIIREYDPDLIHLHNIHGYYLNYPVLFDYLKTSGKRLVWTLHDCWTFTGHCTHYSYLGCRRYKKGCGSCPQLREYPASFFMDASEKNLARKKECFSHLPGLRLVTPSEWLKDEVETSFMAEYPISVIPTGIDPDVFSPKPEEGAALRARYGLDGKKVILGVANPWRERKGINDFAALSEMLDERFKLVMVGLKEKQIRQLPKSILALPGTDCAESLAAWYTLSDVYLNLTLEDTFPTTNLEALSCGTAVVTYDSGGSREALTENTGIVVERGDLNGVIRALKTVITEQTRYTSELCMERAALYSAEKRFHQYVEEVY
ncbi:MAG: glycosyltransferase [Lachnospiraceae bacterium]|nr:glycosyltransferase [Lachnospiraceae bacterium]